MEIIPRVLFPVQQHLRPGSSVSAAEKRAAVAATTERSPVVVFTSGSALPESNHSAIRSLPSPRRPLAVRLRARSSYSHQGAPEDCGPLGSWGRRAGAGRGDSGACIGGAGLKMAYLRPVQILARRDAISPLIPRHPHCLSLRCHSLLFKPRAGGRGGVGRGGGVHTRVWNSSELDCARLCCCARLSAALSCYSFCRFGARLAELQKYKWLLEQEFCHLSFGLLFDISALLWFDAPADEVVQRGEAQRGGGTVGSSVV